MDAFERWRADNLNKFLHLNEIEKQSHKAAFLAGMEEAARIADEQKHSTSWPPIYENACLDVYDAIRKAIEGEQ